MAKECYLEICKYRARYEVATENLEYYDPPRVARVVCTQHMPFAIELTRGLFASDNLITTVVPLGKG